MIRKSEFYQLSELVSAELLCGKYSDDQLWSFLDDRLINFLDDFVKFTGYKISINRQDRDDRGLISNQFFYYLSTDLQHTGRAISSNPDGVSARRIESDLSLYIKSRRPEFKINIDVYFSKAVAGEVAYIWVGEKVASKYHSVHELFPNCVIKFFEDREEQTGKPFSDIWYLLDERTVDTLDTLREIIFEEYGKGMTLNAFRLENRVFRPNTYEKRRLYMSAHGRGVAGDFNVNGVSTAEIHDLIHRNCERLPYLKRLENSNATRTWVHFDGVSHSGDGIYTFMP